MLDAENPVQSESIANALAWWADAGVDTIVAEEPRGWLKRAAAAVPPPPATAPPAAPPATLDDFRETMLALPALAAPPAQRLVGSGDPASGLLILIDMPEPGDIEAGRLLSGEAGTLFDKMLAAINRHRDHCYIAAFCPARLAGGMIEERLVDVLTPLARQHIALAAPQRVWSMGQTASRALIGADARPGVADLRKIHHDDGSVEAVASFSPRVLLQFPNRKKAAWADMQALMRGFAE